MTPKEAVAVAKTYIVDLFSTDGVQNIGLEELRHDAVSNHWLVTIGFTRPWEGPQGSKWMQRESGEPLPRTFKTLEIDDDTGQVLELRHWPAAA